MAIKNTKDYRRKRIKMRIRKTLTGNFPRLSVFRSNKQIYVQIIDDAEGRTLLAASSMEGEPTGQKMTKTQQAHNVGLLIARKAKEAGIESVVFDRSGYLYHGRIKALAEAARKGGLKF
jgi:large subunit ribosomal protein L18